MQRVTLLATAATATLLIGVSSLKAELIYGFNDPTINGFGVTYDGTDSQTTTDTESTGNGVTEGTGALDLHLGMSSGFNQTDAGTSQVPTDLVSASSLSFTAETYYADANYITVAPAFYIGGSFSNTAPMAPSGIFAKLLSTSKTITGSGAAQPGTVPPYTLTYSLLYKDPYATAQAANAANGTAATAADGDSTTTLYSLNQILTAFLAANPGASASYDEFALEETASGTAAGVDLYVDDLTVPSPVPEPASLSVLALGGLLLGRRRRRAC